MYITQNLNFLFVLNNKILMEYMCIVYWDDGYGIKRPTHIFFEMSNNCIMFYDEHYMLRLMLLEINKNPHFPDTPRSNSTVPIESFLNIIWRRDTILMYLYNTTLHATLNFYFFLCCWIQIKKIKLYKAVKISLQHHRSATFG